MWFEQLTGFKEENAENVRNNLTIDGHSFISKVNNRRITFGQLEIISLGELKQKNSSLKNYNDHIKVSEVVDNVRSLHCEPENEHALFQAASQFNLLEMVGPHIAPEQGIDCYERDYTQGPACAIACGAGTIYRNYFVQTKKGIGQTYANQIDCLDLIGTELKNNERQLWTMENGYALANRYGLEKINQLLGEQNDEQRESLKDKLKVGIQWNTEVTVSLNQQLVSQIYCSALPISYCNIELSLWEKFARIILEATYEATLHAAVFNMENNNSNIVYLTLVGGGAFGNRQQWILESIHQVLRKFKNVPLDVRIVSYGGSNAKLLEYISEI